MRRTALVGCALLVAVLVPTPGASAAGPDARGWWSALHREGLAQPPAPPGVDPGELLVQGGDVRGRLPGQATAQPQPMAVAALRFTVGPDSAVTTLTLPVDGRAVVQDLRAYPAAEPFEPVENGPYEKAPAVVLDDFSHGVLSADGLSLSFPDVSRLLSPEGVLSIVLIAGPGDRAVLKAPGPDALGVVTPRGTSDVPDDDGASPPARPGAAGALPPGLPTGPPSTSSAFAPPSVAAAPPPVTGPALAVPPAPAPAAAPLVRRTVASAVDDTRTRILVLLEALLVGVFFGLLGYGPFARLSHVTGLTTRSRGAAAVQGIGRFAAVRSGSAPRL